MSEENTISETELLRQELKQEQELKETRVSKVIGMVGNERYCLQIVNVYQDSTGLVIKVLLDKGLTDGQ